MGVVGQGVQKEIRCAQSCKMIFGGRYDRRKDQSLRRDRTLPSFFPQVLHCRGVRARKPKDAVVDLTQQSHPDVEHLGREFVGVVERAEYEGALGQTCRRTIGRLLRYSSLAVVRQITVRQIYDLFVVMNALLLRDYDAISDDVVVIGRSHRSGKTQKVHLDAARAMREYPRAALASEAHEVDHDAAFAFA